jgi:hypothetical protein
MTKYQVVVLGRTDHLLSIDTTRTAQKMTYSTAGGGVFSAIRPQIYINRTTSRFQDLGVGRIHRLQGNLISLLLHFQNMKSMLKKGLENQLGLCHTATLLLSTPQYYTNQK